MTRALTIGVPFSLQLTASGGTKPYTYSIISGLPAGLSLNASTGAISGTPTTAQTSTAIAWQVEDATTATATDSFNVVVQAVPVAVPHYRFLVELAGLFRLRGVLAVANLEVDAAVGLALGGIGVGATVAVADPEATAGISLGGIGIGADVEADSFATVGIALGGIGVGALVDVPVEATVGIALGGIRVGADVEAVIPPSATVGLELSGIGAGANIEAPPWTPADIATSLWLDDTTATAAEWGDRSGNNYDALQATPADQPTITAAGLNGLDIVTFDGASDHYLTADNNPLLSQFIGVIVCRTASISTRQGVVVKRNPTNSGFNDFEWRLGFRETTSGIANGLMDLYWYSASAVDTITTSTPVTNNEWVLISFSLPTSGGTAAIYKNGTLEGSKTTTTVINTGGKSATNRLYIGTSRTGTQPMDGAIAEVILAGSERERLEGYVAWRWGLQGNLPIAHPYKSAPP